jgi:ribosomal protein S18 acetylase RimI-like enzyme
LVVGTGNQFMIEAISDKNIDEVLPLIRQYLEFYKVRDISDEKNKEFFSQFGERSDLGCQFGYRVEQKMVGFATVYFSFASSIAGKVGVLNDLYTLPEYRGNGVGKALIRHSHEYAIAKGAKRLQWLTAQDNEQAQALYNSLEASRSSWYFYSLI